MNTISQFIQQQKNWTTLIGGAVVGLLLGLLIGWVLWPVQYTNATPGHLRSDFRDDYVLWVANQYAGTGDAEWAREKLGVDYWKEDQLAEALEVLAKRCEDEVVEECGSGEAMRLRALAQALEAAPPSEDTTEPGRSVWEILRPVATVCGSLLLLVLLAAGAWFVVGRLRASRATSEAEGRGIGMAERFPPAAPVSWGADGPPLAQFPTTYMLGDDHYDPSFSIELESGEFMGECGVGVSETIGVGAPNKVTAFEVWLFDKSDIRTVTKVLMSDYAFHDEALCAKLAPKGEPVLAKAGEDIILETKTLRVRARIVEAGYGVGNLPPNSFFERLTIDLVAWAKPGQEGAQAMAGADAPVLPPAL